MGRPRVRTAVVAGEVVGQVRHLFGTSKNAYRNLLLDGPRSGISYWEFQRVWQGKTVTPAHAHVVEEAWRAWRARMQAGEARREVA